MRALTTVTVALGITAIGIGLGLLFTTGKGKKTRNLLSRKSHEYADYIGENVNEFFDTVSGSYENIEAKTVQLAKQVKAEAKKKAADLN